MALTIVIILKKNFFKYLLLLYKSKAEIAKVTMSFVSGKDLELQWLEAFGWLSDTLVLRLRGPLRRWFCTADKGEEASGRDQLASSSDIWTTSREWYLAARVLSSLYGKCNSLPHSENVRNVSHCVAVVTCFDRFRNFSVPEFHDPKWLWRSTIIWIAAFKFASVSASSIFAASSKGFPSAIPDSCANFLLRSI